MNGSSSASASGRERARISDLGAPVTGAQGSAARTERGGSGASSASSRRSAPGSGCFAGMGAAGAGRSPAKIAKFDRPAEPGTIPRAGSGRRAAGRWPCRVRGVAGQGGLGRHGAGGRAVVAPLCRPVRARRGSRPVSRHGCGPRRNGRHAPRGCPARRRSGRHHLGRAAPADHDPLADVGGGEPDLEPVAHAGHLLPWCGVLRRGGPGHGAVTGW